MSDVLSRVQNDNSNNGRATDSTRNLDPVTLFEIHEQFKSWVYALCVQTLMDTSAATKF
jgi:hypothetical protein